MNETNLPAARPLEHIVRDIRLAEQKIREAQAHRERLLQELDKLAQTATQIRESFNANQN